MSKIDGATQNPFEKKLPIVALFVCVMFIAMFSPVVRTANPYWTVYPEFYFYATTGGGPIQFQPTVTMNGWYWAGDLVRFRQLNMGGTVVGEAGFNCTSSGNATLTNMDEKSFSYTVSGSSGVAVTTCLYLSNRARIPNSVTGASSFSWDAASHILTVIVVPPSDVNVVVTWEAITDAIGSVKSTWGHVFTLVTFLLAIAFMSQVARGEGMGILSAIMGFVVTTAVLFMLLNWLERLV